MNLLNKSLSWMLLVFVLSCGSKEKIASTNESSPSPVRTARVHKEHRTIELAGTVRSADVAQLASRFGGFVSNVRVRAGMKVKKGDSLVVLDDRSLRAQGAKLTAAKREAEQAVDAAEAQKRLATSTFERTRALYEKTAASRQEFEEAKSKKEAGEAMYDAALQRVAQTNSDLQDLQTGLDYQRIVAPFDGVVTSVPVDVGTFVSPGQPVVSLENPSRYQVVFSLEEGLLHAVQTNQSIFISIPVITPNQLAAEIDQVSTTIDINTRTFQVKANLPPEPGLRSGLSAKIFLSTEMGHSLWIPQEFLKQKDDIETVLVKEQNRWRRILVKSGDHKDGNVEILSGLNEGELVGLQENP